MNSPTSSTVSCEIVDVGFGVFVAKTPPPCKSLPEITAPTMHNVTSASVISSPYVSISPSLNLNHMSSSIFIAPHPMPSTTANNMSNIQSAVTSLLPPCITQNPLPENSWNPSPLQPLVPADHRLLLWTSPHSLCAQNSLNSEISPRLQQKIFEHLFQATADSTQQSYGMGILCFTQFCDHEQMSENLCMPASSTLLSAFIADAIGTCTGECIHNWLSSLCLWHLFNCAEWHGKDSWVCSLQKTADKAGIPFKCPLCNPIIGNHLACLRDNLNLASPHGASIWAAALTAFWGCCRLGELLIHSSFSPTHNIARNTCLLTIFVNGKKMISFHLPWTKTTGIAGGDCILTATNNCFCPVWALKNHLKLNHLSDLNTPLFAIHSNDSWCSLTKDYFLCFTTGMTPFYSKIYDKPLTSLDCRCV
jgi:hypothetical protein